MEERSNKTIMCSVLFLDIIEYSKKSVAGQISLKDRFNEYLSAAIKDVPLADRIILDTGDGAAINFLGDVEDALKAALSLRESILGEGTGQDLPLLVRAGINLGPVRLVRDINGQPNIVGDGINVAQRIMGFAEADQILVSRSYYDAVSRLSPQYAGMFNYQGSRTDKHVREHEIYSIGHAGEKTSNLIATNLHEIQKEPLLSRLMVPIRNGWNAATAKCDGMIGSIRAHFAKLNDKQRGVYIAMAAIVPVLLVGIVVLKTIRSSAPSLPDTSQVQMAGNETPAALAGPGAPHEESKPPVVEESKPAPESVPKKTAREKPVVKKSPDKKAAASEPTKSTAKPKSSESTLRNIFTGADSGGQAADARVYLACHEGAQLFVDGTEKGKVTPAGLTVHISPGKHKIIVTSKSGELYSENVVLESGKTLRIKPNFCN